MTYDIIVNFGNGAIPAQRFVSFHSATRYFGMYVGDWGIDSVVMVDQNGLELAKWLNIHTK